MLYLECVVLSRVLKKILEKSKRALLKMTGGEIL